VPHHAPDPAPGPAPGQAPGTAHGTASGTASSGKPGRSTSGGPGDAAHRRGTLLPDIRDGLRVVIGSRVLRTLITTGVLINFASAGQLALYVLFTVRTLGLPAGVIGLLTASFGVGGIAGAAVAPRLTGRFSEEKVLLGTSLIIPAEMVVLASAHGSPALLVPIVMTGYLFTGVAAVIFSVCYGSIQLRESPREAIGRVNSVMTVATMGVMTLGGLAGGVLGDLIGLRPALWTFAALVCLVPLIIWFSPLRRPTPAASDPTPTS
jgi:predicted MFS family arabinose efflux permease